MKVFEFFRYYLYCVAISLLILPNSSLAENLPQLEVRIGLNYPQSGPYASLGESQLRGALMATDEINSRGGMLGHRIRLMTKDSGTHVGKTQANIQELLEVYHVKMIFGGVSSDVAIAACELCQEQWVPFFGTMTYSTTTTGEQAHRSCFRERSL